MLLHASYARLLAGHFPSFLAKCFHTANPGTRYLPNWHIDAIAEHLAAAERGEITRLLINMPPRALKSLSVSVAWPAWLLGHDPARRVLAASYSAGLALKHSQDCRHVMQSAWYRTAFANTRIARGQNQKHKFVTSRRGFRLATSVGGTLTGEGGNFIVLDDPQNPAQAESPLHREYVARWYENTLASRLDDKKRGVIALVMQRLHEDDLSGKLLERDGWTHLCLPAIAHERREYRFGIRTKVRAIGDVLHKERENFMLLQRARAELGERAFAAQYQQNPVPVEGALVKAGWLKRYTSSPFRGEAGRGADLCSSFQQCPPPQPSPLKGEGVSRIIQSWDTAIKSAAGNDASACLTFAVENSVAHLIHAATYRVEYPELKRRVLQQAEEFSPSAILMEDKASGQQLLQDLRREGPLPLIAIQPRGDKISRVAAASGMIEAGKLLLPERAPWLAEFETELLKFPNGKHDDQVDALTQFLLWWRGQSREMGVRGI